MKKTQFKPLGQHISESFSNKTSSAPKAKIGALNEEKELDDAEEDEEEVDEGSLEKEKEL